MTVTDTKAPLPESAQRVADHLRTLGYEKNIVMLPATGKTPAEAVAGLGCPVAEIAKPIIFRRTEDDVPVLVIVSGTNRIGKAKVSTHMDAPARADVRFAREKTGYVIGGVCPVGHAVKSVILLDQDLLQYDSSWATTGHPHAVFSLTPAELEVMAGASVTGITQRD